MSPHPTEPREYGDRDLPALVQLSAEPVVVESHFAGWDVPWNALPSEAWTELAREFGERVNLARVETGQNREVAQRYGLEVIPAVLVFSAGEVVARFTGTVRLAEVLEAVHAALRRTHEAEAHRQELASAEPAPARSLLRTSEERHLARAG